ncbi:MAG: DUF6242 domain-containing protein, partial [Elusimicrobia bacterium]|nr:DUF6242 domain-containing protein [Elusimicrobiota bacterium]
GKLYAAGDKLYVSANGNTWTTADEGPANFTALTAYAGKLYAADAGSGAVYQITPVAETLTGADGTTAAQTLTATGLNLAASTNTLACAGVNPCGATNQVVFTFSDTAGNVTAAGPYAVLADPLVSIAVSEPSYPANGAYINLQPNFDWIGPPKATIAGLPSGSSYYLQVSDNDPAFAPGNIVINISTSAVVPSANVPTADAAYISTFTLANNTTYYWRVATANGLSGVMGPWSQTSSFVTDFVAPTQSASFASLSATNGTVTESQNNNLATGVTVQIGVQDATSGLVVSTSALRFFGHGHNDPEYTGGFGVMYSTNAGQSWVDWSTYTAVLSGTGQSYMFSMAVFKGKLYAGTGTGAKIYASADGVTWNTMLSGTGQSYIYSLAVFNGKLYAGTNPNAKVYASADGVTWNQVFSAGETSIQSLAVFNGRLYAGSHSNAKVYVSADGTTWNQASSLTGEQDVQSMAVFNGKLYGGAYPGGKVYASADGVTWNLVLSASGENNIQSLAAFNGKLYAGTNPSGKVYASADGVTWTLVLSGTGQSYMFSMAV